MTIKIHDCSNSSERPTHRVESRGPNENDVMRGLKQQAHVFGFEYVDDPVDADVIITNDVYPADILTLDKPKVKRMDGVFFTNSLKERNEPLNQAALQSTHIIFISKYSENSFRTLYNYHGDHSGFAGFVILNCVDDAVYFPHTRSFGRPYWIAAASNWAREEKRYEDLMTFAADVIGNQSLMLVGECNDDYVHRVEKVGYIDDEAEMNYLLNNSWAFVNLSYRDPAPKVVCQAVNVRLPILYANSGGTPELVDAGVGIKDDCEMVFEDSIPRLNVDDMRIAYKEFENNRGKLRDAARSKRSSYMGMIGHYFWVCRDAITTHERQKEMENRECN